MGLGHGADQRAGIRSATRCVGWELFAHWPAANDAGGDCSRLDGSFRRAQRDLCHPRQWRGAGSTLGVGLRQQSGLGEHRDCAYPDAGGVGQRLDFGFVQLIHFGGARSGFEGRRNSLRVGNQLPQRCTGAALLRWAGTIYQWECAAGDAAAFAGCGKSARCRCGDRIFHCD